MKFAGAKQILRNPAFWLMLLLSVLPAMASLTGRLGVRPHFDLVWDTMNAHRLLTDGEIPPHGCVSGYDSFNPPGITYAFVPGLMIFSHDPVRAERLGAALMFAGTLLGLFMWINPRLGFWPTALSMLIFSVSWAGVFYMTSLWPRGHVFFVIWILYTLTLWVERRSGVWLGVALFIFAAGMYWFMELAPIAIVIPALYVLYRPPLGLKYVALATIASVLLWLPYLKFEATRGFIDVKSLVTQTYASEHCDISDIVSDKSHKVVHSWEVPALKDKLEGKPPAGEKKLDGAFWLYTEAWGYVWAEAPERTYLNEQGFVFYSSALGGWYFQSFSSGRILRSGGTDWEPGVYKIDFPTDKKNEVKPTFSFRAVLEKLHALSPLFNLGGKQITSVWAWHVMLFFGALMLVFGKSHPIRACAYAFRAWKTILAQRSQAVAQSGENARDEVIWMVLLLGLVLPMLFLCVLISSWQGLFETERRFMWLWLTEAAILGAALGTLRVCKWRVGIPVGLLTVYTLTLNAGFGILVNNAFASWPGDFVHKDDVAMKILADDIRKQGRNSAWIGYDINEQDWAIKLRRIDGVTKCGITWDAALLLRYGITNLDTTVEGLSVKDEYRLFSPWYDIPHTDYEQLRWTMTLDGSLPAMDKIADTGDYQILRKPQ